MRQSRIHLSLVLISATFQVAEAPGGTLVVVSKGIAFLGAEPSLTLTAVVFELTHVLWTRDAPEDRWSSVRPLSRDG